MTVATVLTAAAGLLGFAIVTDDGSDGKARTSVRVAVSTVASKEPVDTSLLHALSLIIANEIAWPDSVIVAPYHAVEPSGSPIRVDASRASERGVAPAVDVTVLATLTGDGESAGLVLDVIDVASGRPVGESIRSTEPGVELAALAQDVGRRAATRVVGEYLPPAAIRENYAHQARPPYLPAYLAMADALRAFAVGDRAGAERLARRALAVDPDFIAAKLEIATQRLNARDPRGAIPFIEEVRASDALLSGADRRRLEWIDAVMAGDRKARLSAIENGRSEATAFQHAFELSGVGRLSDALERLDRAEREGGREEYRARELWLRTRTYHQMGRHEPELETARRFREEFPYALQPIRLEAAALTALGREDEVERILSRLDPSGLDQPYARARVAHEVGVELLAHGAVPRARLWLDRAIDLYPDLVGTEDRAETIYASALLAADRWDEARRAYSSLLERDPERVELVGALAVIDAREGHRDRALETYELLAERGSSGWMPGWAERTLWRARIAAALGFDDHVVDLLEIAVARGAAWPSWIHAYPEWRFLADRSELDAWLGRASRTIP